jgi:nucleotide-binding universal stress UspA family protein
MAENVRVIVGVNGSLSSLEALRTAVDEARRVQAELVAVLAWTPVGGEAGYRRAPCPDLLALWERQACARLRNSFAEAFGGFPGGLRVRPLVVRAAPGQALVSIADRAGDLLVVGAGERGWPARWFHGGTSRYCLARAGCRVLAVPPPALLCEVPLWQRHRLPVMSAEEFQGGPYCERGRRTDPTTPRPGEQR